MAISAKQVHRESLRDMDAAEAAFRALYRLE
jgi:hypothetical protein